MTPPPRPHPTHRILVVHSDPERLGALHRALQRRGLTPHSARDPAAAARSYREAEPFQAIVLGLCTADDRPRSLPPPLRPGPGAGRPRVLVVLDGTAAEQPVELESDALLAGSPSADEVALRTLELVLGEPEPADPLLARIQALALAALSAEETGPEAARAVATDCGVPVVALLLRDAFDELAAAGATGAPVEGLHGNLGLTLAGSLAGEAMTHRVALDASELDGAARAGLEETRLLGLRACLALPLIVRGESRGALLVGDPSRDDLPAGLRARLAPVVAALASMVGRLRAELRADALEEQWRAAQRLEAVGSLAGGIAHEFNNLMTGVVGYAGQLRETAPEGDPVRRAAARIQDAAEQAAGLTRDLLTFARGSDEGPRAVDVHACVEEVTRLIEPACGESVTVTRALRAPRHCVLAAPGQVVQVLMNLGLNARDALEGPGTIRFATECLRGERGDSGAVTAERLDLSVSDSGAGIPPELLERIFEPLFTTKQRDRGTGTGLSVVRGIVEAHGGAMRVESEPGRGTTFHVLWPLEAEPAAGPAPRSLTRVGLAGGESAARNAARELLRSMGCEVHVLHEGRELIELLEHGPPLDLAILDAELSAPGVRECLRLARDRAPALPLLVAGDERAGRAASELADLGAAGFLLRPLGPESLAAAVDRALAPRAD